MNKDSRNLTTLTDFYQLTMMQGYFVDGRDENVIFDAFYRENPNGAGYAICAGLESIIDYVKNLKFTEEDITYLRKCGGFREDFLDYLRNFKFTGSIWAIPEGTIIHPMEPLVKVIAPIMEAQFIETALLNFLNHQSLIATKAARVCYAAKGDVVMEFGLRRAQGPDAGTYGARAAVIAGCNGTSNVYASEMIDEIAMGTHAHSWIMSYPDEYTAFKKYATLYPNNAILLVDTYDTLKSGVPNAIKVFSELKAEGKMPTKYGIRLDSGDLAYLSKKAKKMLDEAGFTDAIICASSDLDENLVASLKNQGATINSWGIGTSLITSKDCPAFGGVYKLSGVYDADDNLIPKIKISENSVKITNPGNKTIYRVHDNETNKDVADIIALVDEKMPEGDLTIFDPVNTWKKTTFKAGTYTLKQIMQAVFVNGECVYETPSVAEIKAYCKDELERLWDEVKRFENPHTYYVDLSQGLWDLKMQMLEENSR